MLQGKARVKKTTPKGRVAIDTLLEGDIFGEMILWQSGKGARSASIVAETQVKVGVLDTKRLLKEYESISPRLKSLIKSLIQRLSDTTNKAVILTVDSK
jgi:CRP-like cAMP-binding protein